MFGRYSAHVRILVIGAVLLGSAYVSAQTLASGSLPPWVARYLPGLGGDPRGQRATEIAAQRLTRIFGLRDQPPEDAEVLGSSSDGRFWVVTLHLEQRRAHAVCLVEPAAHERRQLVHYQLLASRPEAHQARDVAARGLQKTGAGKVEFDW